MKKTFRRLLAICLVLMLAFAMSAPAFAINATAPLTKRLLVPGGLTPPTGNFEFVFTPVSVQNSSTIPPNINNDLTPAEYNKLTVSYDGTETSAVTSGGYYVYDKIIPNVLQDTTFPHAGIYTYTVKETAGTITPSGGTVTYSQAEYTMVVYVKNDGSGGLEVSDFVVTQDKDDTGTTTGTKTAAMFTNTYNSDTTLTITKAVAGNFADQTKDFTYTINITGALGSTVAARHVAADGTSTLQTINVSLGTFTLKHGEKMIFESLPIGATYDLTETGAPGYSVKATVTSGTLSGEIETGLAGAAVAVGLPTATNTALQNAIAITSGANSTDWENSFSNNVATGVLMNILPFIILIIVAIGGFAGYVVMRRRKLNHR